MSVNKSLNKVRVTKLFGGSAPLGLLDPAVDMQVKYGIQDYWITNLDSGNYTVDLALSSGGAVVASAYPHDLFVDVTVASGYGWPTADEAVQAGHADTFPNGVPVAVGSGMAYLSGDGDVHTFGR